MARLIEIESIRVCQVVDPEPDLSWLDQTDDQMGDGWEEYASQAKAGYDAGDWWIMGVYAEATIIVTQPGDTYGTVQTIRSGGLYGIDSDADRDYLDSVAAEELADLADILAALGCDAEEIADEIAAAA